MIIDKHLCFSVDQAVTAAAASTDYLDLGAAREIALGKPLYVLVTCTTTAGSAGAATVDFKLQSDDNAAFSSATDLASTGAIGKASLVAGYQTILTVPVSQSERYLRLYYGVATADLNAGKFTASIVDGLQKAKAYPDAI